MTRLRRFGNFGIRSTIGAPPLRSSSSIARSRSGSDGSSSKSVATTSSAICGLPSFSSDQTSPRPASKNGWLPAANTAAASAFSPGGAFAGRVGSRRRSARGRAASRPCIAANVAEHHVGRDEFAATGEEPAQFVERDIGLAGLDHQLRLLPGPRPDREHRADARTPSSGRRSHGARSAARTMADGDVATICVAYDFRHEKHEDAKARKYSPTMARLDQQTRIQIMICFDLLRVLRVFVVKYRSPARKSLRHRARRRCDSNSAGWPLCAVSS